MTLRFRLLVLIGLLAFIIGCGGGGTSSGGGASGPMTSLYITDDISSAYSSVWVTVKKISLDNAAGKSVVAYNDSTGTQLDLRSLHDNSGSLFALIATASLPSDTYTKVHIFVDQHVSLLPTGQQNAISATIAGADANGLVDVNFAIHQDLSGKGFVIDFPLDQWVLSGGVLTPVARSGDSSTLGDEHRHVKTEWRGTVSGLSGAVPNQTFTLTTKGGNSITIQTSSATAVFNNNGSANPSLANGQKVNVRGLADPATNVINADVVRILVVDDDDNPRAFGPPTNVVPPSGDSLAGTFDVTINNCHGFLPNGAVVHIATDANTKFFTWFGRSLGAADFYATLSTAAAVEVVGTYDANSNTITASYARDIVPGDKADAKAKGVPSNPDSVAGTFDLKVDEADGMYVDADKHPTIHVVLLPDAELLDQNYNSVDQSTFFTDLQSVITNNQEVQVVGTYNADTKTLSVSHAKIDKENSDDGVRALVSGPAGSIDTVGKSLVITATHWQDINLTSGQPVTVHWDQNTVFKDSHMNVITVDQFVTLAASGPVIVVGQIQPDGSINAIKLMALGH
ncbi:MAG: DUF4382 domain-containing protein [Armatimonadetes bacterium]|nr:DUF4382 domain-containing protein [Armatimonadota bacterium]